MTRLTGLAFALLITGAAQVGAQQLDPAPAVPLAQAAQSARPLAAAFPDDARVAVVDVDRVASLSGEGKAAAAKLEDLRNKKTAEVTARGREVEALQAKLAQTGSLVDDAARLRLQREFERARIDFQRFTADAEAEVKDAQSETIRWFNARLFPVISALATEKKLWAIFNAEDAAWFDPAIDLTEEVAKRLDQSAAKKH